MPELPEVQTTVLGLKNKVLNRTFVDVWTDTEKLFKNIPFLKFKKEIRNKEIKDIYRRGKNIIFELSNNYFMLVHQKMTGHLLYDKWKDDPMNSFIRVRFTLDNNSISTPTRSLMPRW
jgi:formamidopyrimidine-DNA glycosylase